MWKDKELGLREPVRPSKKYSLADNSVPDLYYCHIWPIGPSHQYVRVDTVSFDRKIPGGLSHSRVHYREKVGSFNKHRW